MKLIKKRKPPRTKNPTTFQSNTFLPHSLLFFSSFFFLTQKSRGNWQNHTSKTDKIRFCRKWVNLLLLFFSFPFCSLFFLNYLSLNCPLHFLLPFISLHSFNSLQFFPFSFPFHTPSPSYKLLLFFLNKERLPGRKIKAFSTITCSQIWRKRTIQRNEAVQERMGRNVLKKDGSKEQKGIFQLQRSNRGLGSGEKKKGGGRRAFC